MKIPKRERVWINYPVYEVVKYICTSKEMDRALYFLYRVEGDRLKKISKSSNPADFDKIVFPNITTALS